MTKAHNKITKTWNKIENWKYKLIQNINKVYN